MEFTELANFTRDLFGEVERSNGRIHPQLLL